MNSPQLWMTYHAAGELLQGGAAALLSVCWLLCWEGRGGSRVSVWVRYGVLTRSRGGGGGAVMWLVSRSK